MRASDRRTLVGRAEMALIGALAGLALWFLIEKAQESLANPHLFLIVASGTAGFFCILLALCGPATSLRSALAAAALALVAALLVGWSSLRFDTLQAYFEAGHLMLAWAVFLFVGTPFLSIWLQNPRAIRDYVRLFDTCWGIIVRYSAAWLFVGLFWAVLLLSGALLEIVGVTVIEDLLDIDLVPYVLSGLMLGLGLAVVYEMRDYVSPYLLLRLLRLLLPVMLIVVIVFVVAVVLGDSSELFGDLSPAATLFAVAMGMISLVSVALGKQDDDAVKFGWMRASTALLALLLPVLVALAGYAVWLRVAQYGWTPARLSATTVAVIVAVYALVYAGFVIMRGSWMDRIRQANIRIAAGILLISALWMTPVLNVEAISSSNQLARFEAGATDLESAPLWELAHAWGRPGRDALERLSELPDEDGAIKQAIAAAKRSDNRYQYEVTEAVAVGQGRALHKLLRVFPDADILRAGMLDSLPEYRVTEWLSLCRRQPDPGCVLVLDDFTPARDGLEGVLLLPGRNDAYDVMSVWIEDGDMQLGSYWAGMAADCSTARRCARSRRAHIALPPAAASRFGLAMLRFRPKSRRVGIFLRTVCSY